MRATGEENRRAIFAQITWLKSTIVTVKDKNLKSKTMDNRNKAQDNETEPRKTPLAH